MQSNVLPDISNLPLWAQILCYSILGISMATVFGLSALGFLRGKAEGPLRSAESPKAQVAAVIVDPTALLAVKDAALSLKVSIDSLSESMDDMTNAMKAMTLEMVRNAGRR